MEKGDGREEWWTGEVAEDGQTRQLVGRSWTDWGWVRDLEMPSTGEGKFIETESTVEAESWAEWEMGNYCLIGSEFLIGMIKMFLKWIVVVVVQHCECNQLYI